MKLIKEAKLAASQCGASAQLSVVGAFQIVEDLVTEMMGELHIDGITCIREYGALWVFVRNRMELRRPIGWGDAYSAECCISSVSNVKLLIDTLLKSGGEIAVASRLELCAVDLETGKIRRSGTVGLGEHTPPEDSGLRLAFTREQFEPKALLEELRVRSSDIDYGRHTNNISYIRYLVDRYAAEDFIKTPVKAVEAQYIRQTFEGDRLQIYGCGENRFTIQLEGQPVMNCRFFFGGGE